MKTYLSKILVRCSLASLLVVVFTNLSFGATNDWTGATSSDWNTAGNWSNGIPKAADAVRIGVVAYTISTNQPTLSAAGKCTSITFGNKQAVILTINPTITLTVSGAMTVNSGAIVNIAGTGTLAIGGSYGNNGTTTLGPGTLTVAGDFNNNSGTTTFGAGTSAITGAFTNLSGTTTFGSGPSTLSGTFTNTAGSTVFGTGLVTFNSGAGSTKITNTPNAVLTFVNVTFTNSGHFLFKTGGGASSAFAVSSTGVLTLTNNVQLDFANTIGLTLNSDALGSATIAALPATFAINGSVFVQRFIQGSSDLTKRGYRLLTSTVWTGTDATAGNSHVYDLQYIANSIFTSGFGRSANGFSVPTTENPSIYLFREDDPPPPSNSTVFTVAYNWKGVAKINNTTAYQIGTQKRNTNYNASDTTTSIPVGNGILVYFRGDKSTTANYISPFGAPQNVTLTETGTLNTGTINVRLWYSNAANGLGNNFSFTSANTAANSGSTGTLLAGFTLVGNPYPSTINWEKYNNGAAAGALTGNLSSTFIYEFNEASRQYAVYEPVLGSDVTSERPSGSTVINGGTNLIASGQGFFVQAGAAGQHLTFTENAKTNTQSSPAVLLNMMGKPVAFAAGPIPVLHLKLSTDSLNTDEIVIKLRNNASTKFVQGEDAWDLGGSDNIVNFSSFSSDSIKLAINYMPFPGLQPEVVRIFAGGTISGTYTIDRMQLDNLPALYRVWLKDGFTGDSVDLKKTTTYSFTVDKSNAATFGANRFTVVFSQDPAMAYKLLSFTGSRVGGSPHAELDWTTENEQSSTNFTVERSIDGGTTFNVAGGLQSTGAGTYSLVDKNAGPGQNLYRLKQEDINNTITYSDVIEIDFGKNAVAVNAYPNPTTNVINVDVNAKSQGKVAYSIVINDSSGAMVSQATSAQSSWQTGVSNLLPGTYLVNVFDQHNNKLIGQAKFVKL